MASPRLRSVHLTSLALGRINWRSGIPGETAGAVEGLTDTCWSSTGSVDEVVAVMLMCRAAGTHRACACLWAVRRTRLVQGVAAGRGIMCCYTKAWMAQKGTGRSSALRAWQKHASTSSSDAMQLQPSRRAHIHGSFPQTIALAIRAWKLCRPLVLLSSSGQLNM